MKVIVYGMAFYLFWMLNLITLCSLAKSLSIKLQVMFSTDGYAFPETYYLGKNIHTNIYICLMASQIKKEKKKRRI